MIIIQQELVNHCTVDLRYNLILNDNHQTLVFSYCTIHGTVQYSTVNTTTEFFAK